MAYLFLSLRGRKTAKKHETSCPADFSETHIGTKSSSLALIISTPLPHKMCLCPPVRGGDVDGPPLVVERVLRMVAVLVPALGDPELHAGPHVHHRDGQGVQLVLAALSTKERDEEEAR